MIDQVIHHVCAILCTINSSLALNIGSDDCVCIAASRKWAGLRIFYDFSNLIHLISLMMEFSSIICQKQKDKMTCIVE